MWKLKKSINAVFSTRLIYPTSYWNISDVPKTPKLSKTELRLFSQSWPLPPCPTPVNSSTIALFPKPESQNSHPLSMPCSLCTEFTTQWVSFSQINPLPDLLCLLPCFTAWDWCLPSHWILPKALASEETKPGIPVSLSMTEYTPARATHLGSGWPFSLISSPSIHPTLPGLQPLCPILFQSDSLPAQLPNWLLPIL